GGGGRRAGGDRDGRGGAAYGARGQRPRPHPRGDHGRQWRDGASRRSPHGRRAQGGAWQPARGGDSEGSVMAIHRVTFLPLNKTVEVDDERYPLADHGKPGSLLDIALANGIELEHNCGGSCACTTCHVIVKEGEENLSEMQEDEEDRLDTAEGLTIHSRLGCQAVVGGDVVVEIPR